MDLILHPILEDCRAIYDLPGVMDRFNTYVDLMTIKRGELLPIGDFSPMGKRQKEFLDKLIAIKAEDIARTACEQICKELKSNDIFRIMLVVVDEPTNGWTQRYLTDADWRFTDKIAALPKKYMPNTFDRWVSINIWTVDDKMNPATIEEETIVRLTRAAIFRAYFQNKNGYPSTLTEYLQQEGAALNFAGEKNTLTIADIKESNLIIQTHLNSQEFPIIFAAMYGDAAAESVGYTPLGLEPMAGFVVAQVFYHGERD